MHLKGCKKPDMANAFPTASSATGMALKQKIVCIIVQTAGTIIKTMENIFLSDTEYEHLATQTENLIAQVDNLPYPKVKDDVQDLLQNFDMLHREALTRLFKEIIINYPALQTKMESDKAIHLLFSLYDLFHNDIQNDVLSREEFLSTPDDKYPRWIPVGNSNELKENSI